MTVPDAGNFNTKPFRHARDKSHRLSSVDQSGMELYCEICCKRFELDDYITIYDFQSYARDFQHLHEHPEKTP